MIALQSFIPVKVGEGWGPFEVQVENSLNPGTFIDLTGYTVCMEVRKYSSGKIFHTFTMTILGDTITIEPSGWIVDIPAYNYQADLMLTPPGGQPLKSNTFLVPIISEITNC